MAIPIKDTDADTIIAILDRYGVNEQVSVLNSLLYTCIISHCANNLDIADQVFHTIHQAMPHHWQIMLGTLKMHDMPVDPKHAN